MKKGSTLRIGIIGVGHLGYFHLKQIITISNIEISGIYDNNKKRAEEVSSEYDVKSFSILNDLDLEFLGFTNPSFKKIFCCKKSIS